MDLQKTFLIFISLFIMSSAFSQTVKLSLTTGIGLYNMEDLKNLNNSHLEDLPFPAKQISNYPPYIYIKMRFLYAAESNNLGLSLTYNTTGSRISSKDYSGEYLFDNSISCAAVAGFIDSRLTEVNKNVNLNVSIEGGALFSNLNFEEHLSLNNKVITNTTMNFKATHFFVEPGIIADNRINSWLGAELSISYLVQLGEKKFENSYGNTLADEYRPSWNGFSIGLTFYTIG